MIIPVYYSIILETVIPMVHKVPDLIITEVKFKTIQGKVLNTRQSSLRSSVCNLDPWFRLRRSELACTCLIPLPNNISVHQCQQSCDQDPRAP